MALKPGYSREIIAENIGEFMRAKKSSGNVHQRAVAAALRSARKSFAKKFPGKKLPDYLEYETKNNPTKKRGKAKTEEQKKKAARLKKRRAKNTIPGYYPNPELKKMEQAEYLLREFQGGGNIKRKKITMGTIDAGFVVGPILAIGYQAFVNGKSKIFMHEFSDAAAPLLISSHDGKQLAIAEGAYQFTPAGIEDKR